MKKQHLLLLLLLPFCGMISAQDAPARRFATQSYMRQIAQNDTAFKERTATIERGIFDFKYFGVMDTVVVPVVFHIVGCNISEQDILAQLAQLNIDFFTPAHPYLSDERYLNPDAKDGKYGLTYLHPADRFENYAQKAAPTMIRFCRPSKDPEGNPTNGIITVASSASDWGIDNKVKNSVSGGSSPWDTQRYCNIWIAPLADQAAGYAQRPGGGSETDGIVVSQQYFLRSNGSVPTGGAGDFALGRTLVHLMGSYLNLHELWNETEPCGDDFVDDTPVHNAPNFGKGNYKHVSACGDNPIEMTMNLMDSGSDSSMYMFTWGQAMRMQATLAEGGPRNSLTYTATACETDGGGFAEAEIRNDRHRETNFLLKVIPNPNAGAFVVEMESFNTVPSEVLVQLYNPSGSLIWEKTTSLQPGSLLRIPVMGPHWPSGVYSLQVITGSERQVKKVLVNSGN